MSNVDAGDVRDYLYFVHTAYDEEYGKDGLAWQFTYILHEFSETVELPAKVEQAINVIIEESLKRMAGKQ